MSDNGLMTVDQARIVLLEDALEQALSMVGFLHGCLTDPVFSYAYPEQTTALIEELRALAPERRVCVHSMTVAGCPGCTARVERFARRSRAVGVLAANENCR